MMMSMVIVMVMVMMIVWNVYNFLSSYVISMSNPIVDEHY